MNMLFLLAFRVFQGRLSSGCAQKVFINLVGEPASASNSDKQSTGDHSGS
jgi:hypothetical protein